MNNERTVKNKTSTGRALKRDFFNRPTVEVAKDLIGCYLVRSLKGKISRHLITETEAYDGPNDLACHGSKGRTKRTEVLFGQAGHFYIYFVYGMYWMLNITTGPKDYPAGVLIRGIDGVNGPGRVTKAVQISEDLYGKAASKKAGLWIEKRDKKIPEKMIIKTRRVGIDYAGPFWVKKKWRFILKR